MPAKAQIRVGSCRPSIKTPRPPAPNAAPVVVWVSPAAGQRGERLRITITGANFSPETAVSVGGTGLRLNAVNVESTTQITATLAIAANAEAGIHNLTVGGSNPAKFRVK